MLKLGRIAPAAVFAVMGIIIVFVSLASMSDDGPDPAIVEVANDTSENLQGLGGTIQIGAMLTVSGDFFTNGIEAKAAVEAAEDDFNTYLEEQDQDWRIKVIVEDTETKPAAALQKIQDLSLRGINIIVGPQTSAEIRNVKGYADANDILLISPSSTAHELAIPDDNVYRLTPDDTEQAPAIARLLEHSGITVAIPISRGDAWGDGLNEDVKESFESAGGTYDTGIRYNPEAAEFSTEVSILEEKVAGYVRDGVAPGEIGIIAITFAEIVPIMQSASQYDVFWDVSWFGNNGNSLEEQVLLDPIALDFAQSVGFATTQVSTGNTQIRYDIEELVREETGRRPIYGAYAAYDAVWIAGLSILETQGTDIGKIKAVLPDVIEGHEGALGGKTVNEAGDMTHTDYTVWLVRDGEWIEYATYFADTHEIGLLDP